MAIIIPNIQKIANEYTKTPYLYQDLHLDLTTKKKKSVHLLYEIEGADIQVDYDKSAIYNSLINLFTTRKGQRFLFPEYGIDLSVYLFEFITDANAQSIGEHIVRSIELYEQRIAVNSCIVEPLYDDLAYNITVDYEIKISKIKDSFNTTINSDEKRFIFSESRIKDYGLISLINNEN